MEGLYSIGKFANKIGVTTQTLRNWNADGSLIPAKITDSGARYYSEEQYMEYMGSCSSKKKKVIGYCRVDGIEPNCKERLESKSDMVLNYMNLRHYEYTMVKDIGARNDLNRNGLWSVLKEVSSNSVNKIVVVNRAELLGIGTGIVEKILELHDVKIEVLSQDETPDSKDSTVFQMTRAIGDYLEQLNKEPSNKDNVAKIVSGVKGLVGKK